MKILIATGLYPPESGGPATFAKLVADKLGPAYDITVVPFATVRQYPKLIRHVVYFYRLWRAGSQADVLLALDPVSVGLPARCVAAVRNLPFIVRLGGDYAWEQGRQRFGVTCSLDEFANQKSLPLGVRFLQAIQTSVVKAADRVIAPSEYLKSIIARWGISPEKIEVIYSVSYLTGREATGTDTNFALAEASPVLLSIGRLVPWKGFSVLIDVVNELRHQYPNILLLIGGDGPEHEALQAKITTLQLTSHVRLLGRLERSEIEVLSQSVDLFVLNTEYEGFSHLLAECMELGLPIVTTKVGGNPELVVPGETGELVPYNDHTALMSAITELVANPEKRHAYKTAAKERVKEFSQERSLERVREVIASVLQTNV
jgi:glycosyltransferase involved in cell wall biosynthesis